MEYLGLKVRVNQFGYPTVAIKRRIWYVHVHVWETAHGPKPKGYDIHHKNENKLDWKLENLALLTSNQHRTTHGRERAGWLRDGKIWTHKPCSMCKEVKLLSEFYLWKVGYSGQCKPCCTIKGRKWRKANPERFRELNRFRMRKVRLKKLEAKLFFA